MINERKCRPWNQNLFLFTGKRKKTAYTQSTDYWGCGAHFTLITIWRLGALQPRRTLVRSEKAQAWRPHHPPLFLRDASHRVHWHRRIHRWCTIHPWMIALQPIVHHRTVLQLFIMIVHEIRDLNLVPPHVFPQEVQSVDVPQLPIQPANTIGGQISISFV